MGMTRIFSFWSGPPTWLERLSVQSALATGHDVTVYTYGDVATLGAFLGCRVLPAVMVSFDSTLDELRRTRPDHFSDHFRLEGIAGGLGAWFDLDIIFIRQLPTEGYIFGWQNHNRVGNSILRFPTNDPCLIDYLAFCRKRPMARHVMPWHSPRQRVTRSIKALTARVAPFTGVPVPAPKYGPDALTHFINKHVLMRHVSPAHIYYPVPIKGAEVARMNNPGFIDNLIQQDTICVHAWRSTYLWCCHGTQPSTGWIANQLAHYAEQNAKEMVS